MWKKQERGGDQGDEGGREENHRLEWLYMWKDGNEGAERGVTLAQSTTHPSWVARVTVLQRIQRSALC